MGEMKAAPYALSPNPLAITLFAAIQNHKRAEKIRANMFAGKLTLD